jgi:hypothetical protein
MIELKVPDRLKGAMLSVSISRDLSLYCSACERLWFEAISGMESENSR